MNKLAIVLSFVSLAAFAAGCGSAREVEVTGEAKAAASVTLSGKIHLSFYDLADANAELGEPVSELDLDKAGPFTQKVDAEGTLVRVVALDDGNGDGKCTEGEAWAQADATVKDDGTVDAVTLELTNAACPAAK